MTYHAKVITGGKIVIPAELRQHTSSVGASLADRAFLALAIEHQANALTGDRRLAALDIGVDIQLIR